MYVFCDDCVKDAQGSVINEEKMEAQQYIRSTITHSNKAICSTGLNATGRGGTLQQGMGDCLISARKSLLTSPQQFAVNGGIFIRKSIDVQEMQVM